MEEEVAGSATRGMSEVIVAGLGVSVGEGTGVGAEFEH